MEKLIELLNEWSKTAIKNKCNWTDVYDEEGVYFVNLFDRDMTMEIEDVISKRNGFIKWLVENEKIEYRKIIEKEIEVGFKLVRIKDYPNKIIEEDVEELLMLLSIQDNPIEFLVSILK